MLKKNLTIGITLMFIFTLIVTPISGFNNFVQDKNQILYSLNYKNEQLSYDFYAVFVGRIGNLSVNETEYAFDCINVRIFSWYNIEGSPVYYYIHYRKNNTVSSSFYRKSWSLSFTHYYYMQFYRLKLNIESYNFSGVLKPSYIIGVFYYSMDNNSRNYNNKPFNNKIECKEESIILHYSELSINFFIGTISDLVVEDNLICFNTTNVFHKYYSKSNNDMLRFGVAHKRNNEMCGYGGSDIQFRGILKPNFICGFFIYKF